MQISCVSFVLCPATMLLLVLCFLPFVVSFIQLSTPPPTHLSNVSDQHALLAFKSAITYDPSQLTTDWTPNVSFCEWTGIRCSRRRQRVISLNVSSMGLQEYGLGGLVTTKGDIYSYGIMLLEMLTRKKPTNNMFVEGMNLPKWVGSVFPNQVGKVVDISLLRIKSSKSIEKDKDLNYLRELINVGLLCTNESPEGRPTMIDIVGALQNMRKTFLRATSILKFQSDITNLLGSSSTTNENIGEAQTSSTS